MQEGVLFAIAPPPCHGVLAYGVRLTRRVSRSRGSSSLPLFRIGKGRAGSVPISNIGLQEGTRTTGCQAPETFVERLRVSYAGE